MNQPAAARPVSLFLVEGEGFEPSKAEPSDLQSDPFDRSGTPPDVLGELVVVSLGSWRWDSNPQPADYKSAALPIELNQPHLSSGFILTTGTFYWVCGPRVKGICAIQRNFADSGLLTKSSVLAKSFCQSDRGCDRSVVARRVTDLRNAD